MKIYAVILAGGKGERFWPLSRRSMPKQFLRLFGRQSLIELTSQRIAPVCPLSVQRFVTDPMLGKILRQLLPLQPENLIIEPCGRNTAPALALAAAKIAHQEPDATLVVLPADHLIRDRRAFQHCVKIAVALAQQNRLVTFGIPPTRADTNYGYIEVGKPIAPSPSVPAGSAFLVRRFCEKPDRKRAERFLRTGRFWWNSGMFVWRADVFLRAVQEHMPDFSQQLAGLQTAIGTRQEPAALKQLYARAPSESVDYAIMEHAGNVAVVRASFDWDDVGSWPALERHFLHDADGNVLLSQTIAADSRNCLVLSDKGIVALLGCQNLIVVRTPDALLVCPKEKVGGIKQLLAGMAGSRKFRSYL